jgi:hypothetical protein
MKTIQSIEHDYLEEKEKLLLDYRVKLKNLWYDLDAKLSSKSVEDYIKDLDVVYHAKSELLDVYTKKERELEKRYLDNINKQNALLSSKLS